MFVKRKKLCKTVIKQDLEDGININYTMLAIYYASRLQSIVQLISSVSMWVHTSISWEKICKPHSTEFWVL